MAIESYQVRSETDVLQIETRLIASGYRLVQKTSAKELQPREYMKITGTGTAQQFEGPRYWVITWYTPD